VTVRYRELNPIDDLSESTREMVKQVAAGLNEETEALAVLLTGPHAMGVDRPSDKMYFIVIADHPDGVIEHRFVKTYDDIDKEMEIGIFPRKFVETLADRGYWDMVSYRAVEALRAAVPVLDSGGHGSRYIEAMVKHLPERRFVSGQIHRVVATFDDAMSLYSKGDFEGAVLVVREALRLAVDLVMKDAARGPYESLGEVVERALGKEAHEDLLTALGMAEATTPEIEQRLNDTLALGKKILKDAGIPDDLLRE
jgi:hypothetical protein